MYVGLMLGVDWEHIISADVRTNSSTESSQFKFEKFDYFTGINLGIQKQFTKNGFFDFRIGTGLQRKKSSLYNLTDGQSNPIQTIDWRALYNYELGIGLTLDNKQIKELPTDCSVFEYHTNKKRIIKLGLINPDNILDQEVFNGAFNIGIETKISTSPFSINANLNYDFRLHFDGLDVLGDLSFDLEPRYYYNLKKRKVQGKTGNSFSANYIGFRSKVNFGIIRSVGFAPVWGIQRQFFKRFLFDYKLGPEWLIETQYAPAPDKDIRFFSELKIGLAF